MSGSLPEIPLQIDIVSDVVCPWCIIGYQQLQRALAELPGRFDVDLHNTARCRAPPCSTPT